MRIANVILDSYSAVVSLIMLFILSGGKRKKDRLRRGFILMCAINVLMIIGDLSNWLCEGFSHSWFPVALRSGVLLFWVCTSLLLLAFTNYLIEYLAPKIRIHRYFWRVALVLAGMHIVGCVLSLWNGMFFTITTENCYQRGPFFWLSQFIPFLIYVLDAAIFIVYRKSLLRKDFMILTSYIVLPLLTEIIQMSHYGIALLNTGVSLSLLIIFINIQSERELRMERQEKELTEARIDIMLSQIKPHFLYNTLTVIRRQCDIDPKQAKKTLENFTLFLRANMDSLSSKTPIPFEQELKHTKSYLAIEQQRQQDRLHVLYEIGVLAFSIPPLTVQPIVENAVRHGALCREDGGTVLLRTEETDSAYLITVQDDGLGIGPDPTESGNCSHIGIVNVRRRLAILCRGTLEIESTPGVGTTAVITIPKEERRL